jgi:spore germination protein
MMYNQDKYMISPLEMGMTIIAFFIGVGILTLPGALAETLDTADGWIPILIAGLLVMVTFTLYVHLQKQFPGQTLLQYLRQGTIGKWWAFSVAVLSLLYFVLTLASIARTVAFVLDMYLLDRTPSIIVVATILLVTSYAVSKGIPGVIHLNALFTPFFLGVFLVIFAFNIDNVQLDPILPLAPKGFMHIFKGLPDTFFSLVATHFLFFFMGYMKADHLRAMPLNIALGIVVLIHTFSTLFTYFVFSVDQSKVIVFSTLELAKEIQIPGGFFERIESLMITVWSMGIFNTVFVTQLLAVHILTDQFFPRSDPTNMQQKVAKRLSATVVFIAVMVAMIPKSLAETFQLGDWLGNVGMLFVVYGLAVGYFTVWCRK